MKPSALIFIVPALFASGAGSLVAGAISIQTVQDPANPSFTQLLGINNSGTIVGFDGAVTAQGFQLTLPNTFTNENFPGRPRRW